MGAWCRGGRRGGVVAGCLVALAVVLILLVIGGVFVAMNWRTWTSKGMHALVEEAVSESALPLEEQREVMAVADTFIAEFETGNVSMAQFGRVVEELSKSPMIPAMVMMGVDESYIAKSALPEEEKAEGSKDVSRFVWGVYDGVISQTKIDDVAQPISAPPGDQDAVVIQTDRVNLRLKKPENVTNEELRAFLANANAAADEAGVPDEQFTIDWSAELQGAIDRAMGRPPAPPPAPPVMTEPPAEEGPQLPAPEDEGEQGGG